ncbi:hypothetical protein L202_04135 [Cryptococcus amylolentus CBS 6039]|uniref:Uncharacterized protein n=1 Tax=Cryptococcus amylolentus CBS 6039 TaxID=1295533 RepID=A0A1E3HQ88_9TREE|nr:hypothetical protein L202_04135 [Cryptococcus amylolentus CBS 6039]ODN78508.1 hypothetical protein L202_04135 [Cryptococcus amylolentus CBS 6039]
MDLWSVIVDVSFLLLTLLLLPSISWSAQPQLNIVPPEDGMASPPPPTTPLSPVTPISAVGSHLSVPSFGGVPSITLTPSELSPTHKRSRRGSFGSLSKKIGHKRKTVSFSLSAIDDVLPPQASPMKGRPPAPFVKGPRSPSPGPHPRESQSTFTLGVTGELPDAAMTHRKDVADSMGVKQGWLMA